jgi:DNA-binding MarR family transcriptional regulator
MHSSTDSAVQAADTEAPGTKAAGTDASGEGSCTIFYDGMSYTAGESVGWMLKRAHNGLLRSMDARMQKYDLTAMQWGPLILIDKGHDTVAACAREADIDSSAMTRMLDRLEVKGLIQRVRSEEDRRVVNLALTEAGAELAKKIPLELSVVLNHHLRGFSADEFETLKTLLLRFERNGDTPMDLT